MLLLFLLQTVSQVIAFIWSWNFNVTQSYWQKQDVFASFYIFRILILDWISHILLLAPWYNRIGWLGV